jgi:hypothetical protein
MAHGPGQPQWLTRAQVIIEQHSRLPTDLAAKKASRLDSERVIMTHLQVGNFEEIVSSIPKVSCDIHCTIKHVYLVALETHKHTWGCSGRWRRNLMASVIGSYNMWAPCHRLLGFLLVLLTLPLRYGIQKTGLFPNHYHAHYHFHRVGVTSVALKKAALTNTYSTFQAAAAYLKHYKCHKELGHFSKSLQ